MKDLPFFTTEYGVASLTLKEIPYRGVAYVTVRSVQPDSLKQFLQECAEFCRAVGAQRLYASGHEDLAEYPLHCSILQMQAEGPWEPCGCLFPVTEQTVQQWLQLYNSRMEQVDNAATLTKADESRLLQATGACFVHSEGVLLGIGWYEDQNLLALASARSGAGEAVARTLLSAMESPVRLQVASTNRRAIDLYERLGFIAVGEVSRWYKIF